jgi:hypothetical protein
MIEVELRHVQDCPHTGDARALLEDCLSELKLQVTFEDTEGEFPSPTILVNGQDIIGEPASQAAACRLDVPTRERLLAALRRQV